MELVKKEQKKLTDKQQQFLDILFTKAKGDPKKAGEIVGYSPNHHLQVVKSLKEEILSKAEYYLALHSGKAVQGIVDALEEDGKTPGVNIRMEAAKQILDRVGIVKKDKIDINAQVAHGIFILPAKDDSNKTQS
tara:strand:+ start:1203 stop:1604 length:402 start_codon:yes stop_codon:yes gene_type:complete